MGNKKINYFSLNYDTLFKVSFLEVFKKYSSIFISYIFFIFSRIFINISNFYNSLYFVKKYLKKFIVYFVYLMYNYLFFKFAKWGLEYVKRYKTYLNSKNKKFSLIFFVIKYTIMLIYLIFNVCDYLQDVISDFFKRRIFIILFFVIVIIWYLFYLLFICNFQFLSLFFMFSRLFFLVINGLFYFIFLIKYVYTGICLIYKNLQLTKKIKVKFNFIFFKAKSLFALKIIYFLIKIFNNVKKN